MISVNEKAAVSRLKKWACFKLAASDRDKTPVFLDETILSHRVRLSWIRAIVQTRTKQTI